MRLDLAALLFVVLSAPAFADNNGTWVDLGLLSGPKPAVFDSHRHRMIVIAGATEIRWADLDAPTEWNHQPVGDGGLAPRSGSAYVYDARNDRIVLVGGGNASELYGDVWELPLAAQNPTWAPLKTSGPIDPRVPAAAVYDSLGDRMLVFGGLRTDPVLGNVATSDVWALSLGESPAWTPIAPQEAQPSPRLEAHAVIDPARRRLVILSGRRNSTTFSDVWALPLDGAPTWSQLDNSVPSPRWAASVVVDPDHDRIVLFGGRKYPNSQIGENGDREDTWVFPLAGGAWTQVPVSGPQARSSAATIYDPGQGRLVVFGGVSGYFESNQQFPGTPLADAWALSLRAAPAWSSLPGLSARPANPSVSSTPYVLFSHPYIDVRNDRVLAVYKTMLYRRDAQGHYTSLPMVPPVSMQFLGFDSTTSRLVSISAHPWMFWEFDTDLGTWTSTPIAGKDYMQAGNENHIGWDPVHRRAVIEGTFLDPGPYVNYQAAITATLGPAPTWQEYTVVGTRPLGNEQFRIYDPLRDRFLVTDHDSGVESVFQLTIRAQATWFRLGGLPFPGNAGTNIGNWSYDASRDRILQVGFGANAIAPTDSVEIVVEWPMVVNPPTWTRLHPAGLSPVPQHYPSSGYDPVRDRLFVFTGGLRELDYSIEFGSIVTLGCGPDVVWNAGGTVPVSWEVTNPTDGSLAYDYTLSVDRNWPGYPLQGQVILGAGQTQTLTLQVSAPDTATVGSTALTLKVQTADDVAYCTRHLHDSTTPTLLSFADGAIDGGAIVVSWFGAEQAGLPATLERKREGEDWSFLATLTGDPSGRFAYRDEAPIRGARSIYRLSVGSFVSESQWFHFEGAAVPLALSGGVHVLAGGGLDVEFTLPAAGRARFVLVDAAGRRLLDRAVDGLEAGQHTLRLIPDRALRAGVYFMRLEQGAEHARAKVVALP